MYDSFAQPESDHDEIAVLINNPRARRVVVYTWNFTPTSSTAHADRAYTATSPKPCPRATLSPPRKPCTPGRPSSAPHPRGPKAHPDWTGQDDAKDSPTAKPKSWPSSPKAKTTPTSPASPTSAPTPSSPTSASLPKNQRHQPNPSRPLGRPQRLHPRPPTHRPLAQPAPHTLTPAAPSDGSRPWPGRRSSGSRLAGQRRWCASGRCMTPRAPAHRVCVACAHRCVHGLGVGLWAERMCICQMIWNGG